jgi:hypothetical protein
VESDRSEYRLESTNVIAYTMVRPRRWLSVAGRLGWLARPTLGAPAGSFKRGYPATSDVFPDDPVYLLTVQPTYVHGEASLTADTRDRRGYPSSGGLYRVAWSTYSDRDSGAFTFDRYEAEGAQFLPLARHRVVLALHGWLVASAAADGRDVPFYLMPSLGGGNTLRGYADYRFHDRNLLVVNAEARVPVFAHMDTALFVDAGSVAARVGDLDLGRTSYGMGLRLHSRESTFARLVVAHGDEGWRLLFRVNDPFRLGRLSRRTAAVPFVP